MHGLNGMGVDSHMKLLLPLAMQNGIEVSNLDSMIQSRKGSDPTVSRYPDDREFEAVSSEDHPACHLDISY